MSINQDIRPNGEYDPPLPERKLSLTKAERIKLAALKAKYAKMKKQREKTDLSRSPIER